MIMQSNEYAELVSEAKQGDCYAQNTLAAKLAQTGEVQNLREALFWYLEAVESGFVDSIWNAGSMLMTGEGDIKDTAFGVHLIKIAATCGHSSACLFLSNCYENGLEGFDKNLQLADQWKKKAWEDNNDKDFTSPIDVDRYMSKRPIRNKGGGDN